MIDEIKIQSISVTGPVGKAIERTKVVLFSPFDLGKWFIIGFCAWLAFLGEGGFNFNGNWGGGNCSGGRCGSGGPNFDNIREGIEANLFWIIPVGIIVLLSVVSILLGLTWLRCRGKFMFLYCVAQNKAEVAIPWKEYKVEANSLFFFKVIFGVISAVCFVPLMIGWFLVMAPLMKSERLIVASIGLIVVLSLLTITLGILLAIIVKFTDHFVVPTMYLRRIKCLDAWKLFWQLLKVNLARFAVFTLFLLVLNLATGVLIFMAAFATCCCACCFLAIPFIGTVVMLPILVFMRSYSAYYLAQYGPQWDVFAPAAPTVLVAAVEPAPIDPNDFFRGQPSN